MRNFPKGVQLIIALLSVIVGASVFFIAARWLLRVIFNGVNTTVAAAIVAAVATGIASLLAVILQRRSEERQQFAAASREQKVDLYETFLRSWFDVFGVGVVRTPQESQDVVAASLETITKMIPAMISWASDSFLIEWSRLRRATITGGSDEQQFNLLKFEQVLLAIRRDLGHKNQGIEVGDLLGLWVNDIDKFVKDHPKQTRGKKDSR
jgi:hypothetical protein